MNALCAYCLTVLDSGAVHLVIDQLQQSYHAREVREALLLDPDAYAGKEVHLNAYRLEGVPFRAVSTLDGTAVCGTHLRDLWDKHTRVGQWRRP